MPIFDPDKAGMSFFKVIAVEVLIIVVVIILLYVL